MKIVEVWLTKAEREDKALRQQLRQMYEGYQTKKYKVAEYHSGSEELYAATRDLLLYNRKRIAELEQRAEKSMGEPDISAGNLGMGMIQC